MIRSHLTDDTTGEHEAEAEALCREFARVHPTKNVLLGVELCEAGRLAWIDVAALFARSYGTAKLEAVPVAQDDAQDDDDPDDHEFGCTCIYCTPGA